MEAAIHQIIDFREGHGKNGYWQKISYLVKGDKIMLVTSWAEDCELVKKLTINDRITFDVEISAREYQGRWYNDVTARNVVSDESNSLPPLEPKKQVDPGIQGNLDIGVEDISHDLPF